MKLFQFLVAVLLLVSLSPALADPPDPHEGASQPTREQNLDDNDWIAVHEQGTAKVEVQGVADVNITGGQIDANITGGEVEVTGGSIQAELTGGEVDVNVVSTVPCEAPVRVRFIGITDGRWLGDTGLLALTYECREQFGFAARMCNTVEVMESTGIPYFDEFREAWVRPVIVGDGLTDASGVTVKSSYFNQAIEPFNLSCNGWSQHADPDDTFIKRYGMTVDPFGRFKNLPCNTYRPVACCKPVQ